MQRHKVADLNESLSASDLVCCMQVVLPWMTTAYTVICNIPELEESGRESAATLFLDLQLLIMIRRGAITHWNHPRLVELNPVLRDVDQPLLLVMLEGQGMVSKEIDYILDQYVQKYPFSYSNPEYGARVSREDSYSKVRNPQPSSLI